MCGIAGLFSDKQHTDIVTHIQKMIQIIQHRGPDDEGYLLFNHKKHSPLFRSTQIPQSINQESWSSAMGHCRLSILDLSSAGRQPMCSAQQRYWISYNGEVYNYQTIRAQLIDLGYTFQSNTDTEVVLKAYEEWGQECLQRFNGMFAFIIYDTYQKRIFAARDRFGIKPLYYWLSPKGFLAIASEIKQFTQLPGWCAKINKQRTYDFLTWSALDHTEETLFNEVFQLQGGHCFDWKLSSHSPPNVFQWYQLTPKKFSGTEEEAALQLHSLLEDSVRLRLHADVEVGSCLSGGLDSSSIVCLVHKILKEQNKQHKQKTFSAYATEKRWMKVHTFKQSPITVA